MKGYVGQTTHTLERRWSQHCYEARHGSKDIIHCAIRKYGEDAFEVSVLAETDNIPDLNKLEVEQIEKQGTLVPNGYNMTAGGRRPNYSVESRAKMAAAAQGNKNGLGNKSKLGQKLSPETRAKMSIAHKKLR